MRKKVQTASDWVEVFTITAMSCISETGMFDSFGFQEKILPFVEHLMDTRTHPSAD